MSRRVRDRTSLLIATVAAGGFGALAAALITFPPPDLPRIWPKALVLLCLTAAAELIATRFRHGREAELITLFEFALVANLVLLPATLGAAVAIAGLAIALAVQCRSVVKALYNIGQYALGAVAAATVYLGFGGGDFETTEGVFALAAGMGAFAMVNLVTIAGVIAATEGRPLREVFREEGPLSITVGMGNATVGIVAVSLYLTRPLLLPAVLAPLLALHLAFRGWVQEKKLSEEMEAEKRKLERIIVHSTEGIILAEGDGTVLVWSPSMEQMTGIPAGEAEGRALPFLLRGRGQFGESVQVTVTDDPQPVELEVTTAAGENRWVRVQHGPAQEPDGRIALDVLVVHDITRQREVDRLKDDFIMTVSHELRTPLTPIKGYAALLLRRSGEMPEARRREALQSILERTDHMARLVEDLLLASRIGREGERRIPETRRQPVDLARTIEKVLRSCRLAHPHRDFQQEGLDSLTGQGDPIRIEQVIANLVSNAVKFSEEGTLVTVRVLAEGGRARIDVQDEGRGIPSDRIDEIFEKFRRLEDPLRMQTGGAGLGLYLVKKLVDAMGGQVGVRSTPGEGSTFTVWLDRAEGGSAAVFPRPLSVGARAPATTSAPVPGAAAAGARASGASGPSAVASVPRRQERQPAS